jgi:hypothetical protein
MRFYFLIFIWAVLLVLADSKGRFDKKGPKQHSKPKPASIPLDVTAVPTIDLILEEAGFAEYKSRLVRMGITDTRLLLRLQPMDFRIMEMEWTDEGMQASQLSALQAVVSKYYQQAKDAASAEVAPVINKERAKLNYGKIVLPHSVQSFEFVTASFGGTVPRGLHRVQLDDYPHYGCRASGDGSSGDRAHAGGDSEDDTGSSSSSLDLLRASFDEELSEEAMRESELLKIYDILEKDTMTPGARAQAASQKHVGSDLDLSSKVFVVRRGDCSYLEKAMYAVERNATALIIVNHADRIDAPASGYGVDKSVTLRQVESVRGLPIVSISNTSWSKLSFAATDPFQNPAGVHVQFIPLKCGGKGGIGGEGHSSGGITSGKTCEAVEDQERKVQWEVSAGHMHVRTSSATNGDTAKSPPLQFLTSNFGGTLPLFTEVQLIRSVPADACADLEFHGLHSYPKPIALVIDRGGCPFHVKMQHADRAGARLAIIINILDEPLQRIGGLLPYAGYIGMPAVLFTAPAGAYLVDRLNAASASDEPADVIAEIMPASGSSEADAWIDMAFFKWHETAEGKSTQYVAIIVLCLNLFCQVLRCFILLWLCCKLPIIPLAAVSFCRSVQCHLAAESPLVFPSLSCPSPANFSFLISLSFIPPTHWVYIIFYGIRTNAPTNNLINYSNYFSTCYLRRDE